MRRQEEARAISFPGHNDRIHGEALVETYTAQRIHRDLYFQAHKRNIMHSASAMYLCIYIFIMHLYMHRINGEKLRQCEKYYARAKNIARSSFREVEANLEQYCYFFPSLVILSRLIVLSAAHVIFTIIIVTQ